MLDRLNQNTWENLEVKPPTYTMLIDISAAYDNVLHSKMLKVLKKRIEIHFDPIASRLLDIMAIAYK